MLHEVVQKLRYIFLLRYILICIGELTHLQPTGRKEKRMEGNQLNYKI